MTLEDNAAHSDSGRPAHPGVPDGCAKERKRILIATHFGGSFDAAADAAATLARALGGSIHLLCVLEAPMYGVPDMARMAERDARTHPEVSRRLQEATDALRAQGVAEVDASVAYGVPGDVILRVASEGRFSLLVIGSSGRGGGVAAELVARAKIPEMAIPESGARAHARA